MYVPAGVGIATLHKDALTSIRPVLADLPAVLVFITSFKKYNYLDNACTADVLYRPVLVHTKHQDALTKLPDYFCCDTSYSYRYTHTQHTVCVHMSTKKIGYRRASYKNSAGLLVHAAF